MTQPHNLQFTREILFNRHRLSHQQIDEWLDEKESKNYLPEKLEQMAQMHEFLLVTDALNNAGIPYLSLKGPLLSYRLYRDATYRLYCDFDFLLDLSFIERSLDCLYDIGYLPVDFKWPKNQGRKKLAIKHNKHVSLQHPDKNTRIELHWKLFNSRIADDEIIQRLIEENKTIIEYTGRKFVVFKLEFELLFLIIHGGLHFWRRLKWLVDIHQLQNLGSINMVQFVELSSLFNAKRMVALCNAIMTEFYPNDKKLPEAGIEISFFSEFALRRIFHTSDNENVSNIEILNTLRYDFTAFPGYRYKYDQLKRLLFYQQGLDNENIPSYSLLYYLLGLNRRILIRIKRTFQSRMLL